MKLKQIFEQTSRTLSDDEREIIGDISESIDHLNDFLQGKLAPIDPEVEELFGLTTAERDAKIQFEHSIIQKAFRLEPEYSKKPLYRGVKSFNDIGFKDRYTSCTYDLKLAQSYGGKIIEILPGAKIIDLDKISKRTSEEPQCLFNIGQQFDIVDQKSKSLIIVRAK